VRLRYVTAMTKFEAVATALRNITKASVGRCPLCGYRTVYVLTNAVNAREGFQCVRCRSIARNRLVALALCQTLGFRALSEARSQGLDHDVYIAAASGHILKALPIGLPRLHTSELVPGVPLGDLLPDGHSTCQDLERLTYGDASFDLVVTEDVLEHVRDPGACLHEIHRILRPGGQHIFTVPFYYDRPTLVRVDTSGQEDVLLMEEEWHGDHIRGRILAYRTFGYDIFDQLRAHGFESRLMLPTTANRRAGIHDSVVFVTTKRLSSGGHQRARA